MSKAKISLLLASWCVVFGVLATMLGCTTAASDAESDALSSTPGVEGEQPAPVVNDVEEYLSLARRQFGVFVRGPATCDDRADIVYFLPSSLLVDHVKSRVNTSLISLAADRHGDFAKSAQAGIYAVFPVILVDQQAGQLLWGAVLENELLSMARSVSGDEIFGCSSMKIFKQDLDAFRSLDPDSVRSLDQWSYSQYLNWFTADLSYPDEGNLQIYPLSKTMWRSLQ